MLHVNKKYQQELELRFKLKNRPRMNIEWIGKNFQKN